MSKDLLDDNEDILVGIEDKKEQSITYFGYGSLVNRATRASHELAYPARLYGWQRVWGHRVRAVSSSDKTVDYQSCSLSIQKQGSASHHQHSVGHNQKNGVKPPDYIDGVIANVKRSDLPMLDKRETGYDRVIVPSSDFELPDGCDATEVHVYVSDATHSGPASDDYPILQSYIDCVLAGYCDLFKESGMQQFVDSTLGWEGAIKNDRDAPLYPRAVTIAASQLAQFDELVNARRLSGGH